jgi:hypothetical protein
VVHSRSVRETAITAEDSWMLGGPRPPERGTAWRSGSVCLDDGRRLGWDLLGLLGLFQDGRLVVCEKHPLIEMQHRLALAVDSYANVIMELTSPSVNRLQIAVLVETILWSLQRHL